MAFLIAIVHFILANKIALMSFGGLAITSAVKVMPPPGTPFNLYTFLYEWAHQFLNLNVTPKP
jgi:hypothetical protein